MSQSMTIPLSNRNHPGLVAIVDDEDYDRLMQHRWKAELDGRTYYARRTICRSVHGRATYTSITMHREVLGVPPGVKVDHENGNGLDNRKANLRQATTSQNGANRRPDMRNATGYKGVHYVASRGKWQASIRYDGKSHWLGYHDTPEAAAAAYDAKAREVFGSFALCNLP